jgi:hypothetical protein
VQGPIGHRVQTPSYLTSWGREEKRHQRETKKNSNRVDTGLVLNDFKDDIVAGVVGVAGNWDFLVFIRNDSDRSR